MPGSLYAGRCYDTGADAAAAVWSGVSPVLSGSPQAVSVVSYSGAVWHLDRFESGALVSSVPVPAVAFAPCDPVESVTDGLLLGSLVVGVWVVAWAIAVLRRVFDNEV